MRRIMHAYRCNLPILLYYVSWKMKSHHECVTEWLRSVNYRNSEDTGCLPKDLLIILKTAKSFCLDSCFLCAMKCLDSMAWIKSHQKDLLLLCISFMSPYFDKRYFISLCVCEYQWWEKKVNHLAQFRGSLKSSTW